MSKTLNRRNFLRGSAVIGAGTLAAPAIAANHGTTLKMQAAWGGGIAGLGFVSRKRKAA